MKNLSAYLARLRPQAADAGTRKEKALAISAILHTNGWALLKEELDAFLADAGRRCSDPATPDDALRIAQAHASGIRWVYALLERYRVEAEEIKKEESE